MSSDTTYKIIYLNDGSPVKVDPEDYEWANSYKWRNAHGYARAGIKAMHRMIMKPPQGLQVDHISGDTFDNRRSNLRLCTPRQNAWNRAGKGVRGKRDGGYVAGIVVNYRRYYLGFYRTEEEAMRVYDAAARYYFGEFARTNFPGTEAKSVEEIRADGLKKPASPYRGVRRGQRKRNPWVAAIQVDMQTYILGSFPTQEDAARAYDRAIDRFGLPTDRKNFPNLGEPVSPGNK